MSIALCKPTRPEDASPAFETGRKLGIVEMALMWKVLHEDPQCPSRVGLEKVAQRQVPMAVSVRHLNRLRAQWNLNRGRLLLDSRVVDLPMSYNPIVVTLSSLKSFF